MSHGSAERSFDIVIVGGGVMGCSVAYHLASADPGNRVAVIEQDPSYTLASSALSMGNVRVQFSLAQNIEVSSYALEVLAGFQEAMEVDGEAPDLAFKPEGNLFLVDAAAEPKARQALERQRHMGCEVEWWSPTQIEERFPQIRAGGFSGGTFSAKDGHLDGYAFLMAYRRKASSLGALLLEGRVEAILQRAGAVTGVMLAGGARIDSPVVVNCAGAWAAGVAATVGIDLPVRPVQRQVFVVEPAAVPARPLPLTNLPSGLFFRSEGLDRLLVGKSLPEDRSGFALRWEESRFNDRLWPELVQIAPSFERLRFERGWAGLYAVNTLDGSAILGEWPQPRGLYLANGFSGHGLQQAPAVGRYLSELILGREPILDLSVFSPERILEGRPIEETALI